MKLHWLVSSFIVSVVAVSNAQSEFGETPAQWFVCDDDCDNPVEATNKHFKYLMFRRILRFYYYNILVPEHRSI